MLHEKRKLEEEIVKLRDQLMQTLNQVSHEKDRCASKVLSERAAAEREIQHLQAEMLKTQAELQMHHAQRLQSVQVDKILNKINTRIDYISDILVCLDVFISFYVCLFLLLFLLLL